MATARSDNIGACSICMEPYRGRQPKVLQPCRHVFCTPCLKRLADRSTPGSCGSGTSSSQDHRQELSVTIICPTCRAPCSLPPGGVTCMTSAIVDDGATQNDQKPLLCGVCEKNEKLNFTCPRCTLHFCSACRHTHDKLCGSPIVREVSSGTEGRMVDFLQQGQSASQHSGQPVQLLKQVLKTLAQRKKRLTRESKDKELEIHELHRTLLRHAGEARDAGLAVVRDVTQNALDVMEADLTLVSRALAAIEQQSSKTGPAGRVLTLDDVLTGTERRHLDQIVQRKDTACLTINVDHNCTQSLRQSLLGFLSTMGSPERPFHSGQADLMVDSQQGPSLEESFRHQEGATSGKPDFPQDTDVRELAARLDQLTARVNQSETVTQNQNTLCRYLSAECDKNSKLYADVSELQTDMKALRDRMTSLHHDFVSTKDKNVVLCQDNEQLRIQVTKLQTEQGRLQTELNNLGADVVAIGNGNVELGKNLASLTESHTKDNSLITRLQSQIGKLEAQVSFHVRLKNQVTLKGDQTLVCDVVVDSVGGGYDSKTGIFTVPTAGTYCFIATATPWSEDVTAVCSLQIMVDEKRVAILAARGKGRCTGHAAVQLRERQKVWLKAVVWDGHRENMYYGHWVTTFTGMLIHPDL